MATDGRLSSRSATQPIGRRHWEGFCLSGCESFWTVQKWPSSSAFICIHTRTHNLLFTQCSCKADHAKLKTNMLDYKSCDRSVRKVQHWPYRIDDCGMFESFSDKSMKMLKNTRLAMLKKVLDLPPDPDTHQNGMGSSLGPAPPLHKI